MKRIVAGILAHVDSGKTTLSEGMLYCAGEIRTRGRVDRGSAFLDNNEIERDRGITIFSKQAVLHYNDSEITLLDTPGHVDFSTETERTLSVLDYAVLVISGTDGVQNHTHTLWKLLRRYNIPVFVFVNKMDISHFARRDLIQELCSKLGGGFVDFSDTSSGAFFEDAAVCDEALMEEFLEKGALGDGGIVRAIKERKLFPCCFGAALKYEGVREFMETLDRFTAQQKPRAEFGARVFKIADDGKGARLTYMKVTGGALKVKDMLCGVAAGEEWSEKADQIRIYSGARFTAADTVYPGSVCAVTGLTKTYPGEGLGAERDAGEPVLEPVLSYSVILPEDVDVHTGLEMLKKLEEEEPKLHIVWNERLEEITVQVMGEVQLEVLKRLIKERFSADVEFGSGRIAYKETIASPAEGIGHYEPLRHYAEVHLLMEPLARGSGLVFASDCSEDELDRNRQRLVMTHLREKTYTGILTNSPLTDMRITLIAGRAHLKHTEGGDFRQATYRAVRHGLRRAGCVLLEPWYDFTLELPSEYVGRAMTDIQRMGGEFEPPEASGEYSLLRGSAPVAGMRGYHTELTGYTRGTGRLSCVLKGYRECADAESVIQSIGYDCDSDIDNTADSVFCSHGAGYAVKWDEVENHAHIKTGVSFGENKEVIRADNVPAAKKSAEAVSEKELMKIFERTYGEIRREPYAAMYTKKSLPAQKQPHMPKGKPLPDGPEYLLVDGYNIVFAWEDLKALAAENLDLARNRLVQIMSNYQGLKQCELILVFDAYKVRGGRGEIERTDNITVVYTKEAETADMYIEKVTREIGKKHRVRVATSDNLEQLIILGGGAVRVSADAFKKEVDAAQEEMRKMITKGDF